MRQILRGKGGKKLIEVDSSGRELKVVSERRPIDGSNLMLTIDLELQKKVTEVLAQYTGAGDNAAAAVMDVKTGELLAMVSLPTFDNNVFSGPLTQRTTGGPDGLAGQSRWSTTRSLSATPRGARSRRSWEQERCRKVWRPRGRRSRAEAISRSRMSSTPMWSMSTRTGRRWVRWTSMAAWRCLRTYTSTIWPAGKSDEGFAGLGEDRVAKYARAFGLGEATGVDLPGESPGLVPDAALEGGDDRRAVDAGRHLQLRDRPGLCRVNAAADPFSGCGNGKRRGAANAACREGVP